MAEQINVQPSREGGTPGWIWAIVVLLVVAVLAWFVMNRTSVGNGDKDINVNVETPATGGSGGGGQ